MLTCATTIRPTPPRPMLLHRLPALFACAALLAGCAGFEPQPGPGDEPAGRYVALTKPIIAIGDTQEHEATGVPLLDNDNAIDAYVEVTQRPPEQPLFGRRVMEWALLAHPGEPFIHLGDLLDLSCRSEARRMRRLFDDGPVPGALLPGNHDGLMFGIYGYDVLGPARDPGATQWNAGCRRGADLDDPRHRNDREAFTKRDFIVTYLDGLRGPRHGLAGLPSTMPAGNQRISWINRDRGAFVTAIEASLVDGGTYGDSFVAQRLRLPAAPGAPRGAVLVGLDTNQTGPLVSSWGVLVGESPGSVGHVRLDQIRAVAPWVEQAVRDGDIVVFAGHHNWRSLDLPSRVALRELMARLDHPLVYLSAHTHRGFWAVHRGLDRRPLLELNVSSLSDWPIAYRRISFAYDAQANRLLVRGDLMPAGDRPHASDADLLAAWQTQACAAAGYPPDYLRMVEGGLVERQRASRGSLLTFVREQLSPACDECEADRYARAGAYQDGMLLALIETGLHLGPRAHQLEAVQLPAFCRGEPWYRCASSLLAERAPDPGANATLFRRKAHLVDVLGEHLDDLDDPQAKAYMTCRAVQAAKLDFDGSDDRFNSDRGEAKRRAEQFFRIEASVGMD